MKTEKICVRSSPADEKLPLGASKLFGDPDVFPGFDWPEYLDDDGESYCMDFICQINCRDVAHLDKNGLLPKTGILYFFYPLENTPFYLRGGDAPCYYYSGNEAELHQLVLRFDDGEGFGSKEQRLEFSVMNDKKEFPDHHLLGEPSMPPFDGDKLGLENKILLFELYSCRTEDRTLQFWDDGTLQFYIDPEKLKSGDLSDVRVRLNTT